MTSYTFTGLYPQTPGNPLMTFVWRGTSPVDAIVRQWATCLPGARMATPVRCEADGHIYHLALDGEGYRQITVRSRDEQFITETH